MTQVEPGIVIEELEEARKVQMGMLPQTAPDVPGFEIASHIAPALSVGGDFYDFIALPGDRHGIVFGDAVGHGIASALLMAMTLTNFRFVAPVEIRPQTVIEHINHHLCLTKGVSRSSSVTAVYSVIDINKGTVECSTAGIQPYLIGPGRCDAIEIGGTRFPLGITDETAYDSVLVELHIGEAIVLCSDGIPEATDRSGVMYGFDRLEAALRGCGGLNARGTIEAVLQDLQRFVADEPQQDDISMVVIRRTDVPSMESRERRQRPILASELVVKSVFQYVMSPKVIDLLVKNPAMAQLDGAERVATILFSDIRGVTELVSSLAPKVMCDYLNEYFEIMTQIILDNDGTLDKFVGDEIMAIWGAPVSFADHAYKACKAALEMQEVLKAMRVGWREKGLPEVRVGIGINSGPMVIGSFGAKYRMYYTPLGEHVNIGARLEGTNKKYGTDILISEYTYEMAKDRIVARMLDSITTRLKTGPSQVAFYELTGLVEEKIDGS